MTKLKPSIKERLNQGCVIYMQVMRGGMGGGH